MGLELPHITRVDSWTRFGRQGEEVAYSKLIAAEQQISFVIVKNSMKWTVRAGDTKPQDMEQALLDPG